MKKTKRQKVEYRYYEMPDEIPLLALLGNGWIRPYGEMGLDTLHFHNHFEIGYCYEGHGTLSFDGTLIPYAAGTLSMIPHNVCHTTVSDEGMLCRCEYLFVDVEKFIGMIYADDTRFAKRLAGFVNQQPLCFQAGEQPVMTGLVMSIIEEMRGRRPFYLISVRGLLLALMIEIVRQVKDEEILAAQEERDPKLVISQALQYISLHHAEELKIGMLAQECHMSETHFRRVFKAIMQLSPLEYINLVRVEAACNLLRSTDYAIEVIARRVGYPTPTTFERNFRKVTDCTPLQWKNDPSHYEMKLRNYQIASFQGWR